MGRHLVLKETPKGKVYRGYSSTTDHFTTPYLNEDEAVLYSVLENLCNPLHHSALHLRQSLAHEQIAESYDLHKQMSHGVYYHAKARKQFFSDWREELGKTVYESIRNPIKKEIVENKKYLNRKRKEPLPETVRQKILQQTSNLEKALSLLDRLMGKK